MSASCIFPNNIYYRGVSIWQWDKSLSGSDISKYFVLTLNLDLAEMQGVTPGNAHVECIVDDFGNLVRFKP